MVDLVVTSVGCVVDPSVNPSLFKFKNYASMSNYFSFFFFGSFAMQNFTNQKKKKNP
jgi:hypothetical protein